MATQHYRVNIGHYSPECFHFFNDEERMFLWISDRIDQRVCTYEECEEWTRLQDDEFGSYIEILVIDDLKKFYKLRKKYVLTNRLIEDVMDKARRLPRSPKRDRLLEKFSILYDNANKLAEEHPEIWMGEI